MSAKPEESTVHTATTVFLETLYTAGIEVCFVNLGSDHPSFVEAMAIANAGLGRKGAGKMPRFITVTHEMVALSAAQGYYQSTGKMAAVILHVDCGLLNAGGAIHNVYRARCPVVVFSGLSAVTFEGEARGSRTEFINWVQDVHDQGSIVRNYTKYTYEFRSSYNIAQATMRACQIAMTEPRGPVYLFGAREVLEASVPVPAKLDVSVWQPPSPSAMPASEVEKIANLLVQAKKPLVITSWLGNNPAAAKELLQLAELLSVPVLDHCPFALNFPTTHPLYQGTHWSGGGQNSMLAQADLVLVVDSDIPWIPMQNKPSPNAIVVHIDSDPLKAAMPLFYIAAQHRYSVNSEEALRQLNLELSRTVLTDSSRDMIQGRYTSLDSQFSKRSAALDKARTASPFDGTPQPVPVALGVLARCLPKDTFLVSEAISNYGVVHEHLGFTDASRWATSGASSLGYGGGASVGARLGIQAGASPAHDKNTLVCCITGDGSYMFSVPSTVQHLSSRYSAPFLTIILVNGGWKSPKLSTLLVHPSGVASRSKADDINVGFGPLQTRPKYGALAVAAAGGSDRAWSGIAVSGSPELEGVLVQAINWVKAGRSATVEIVVPDL